MVFLFFILFSLVLFSFFLSFSRFLHCLIILENFNVILILFCLIGANSDSHMTFIVLMVVSTIEIVVGLVVLTRVWECTNSLDLVSF